MTAKSAHSGKSFASIQGMSIAADADMQKYAFSLFDDIKPDDIR